MMVNNNSNKNKQLYRLFEYILYNITYNNRIFIIVKLYKFVVDTTSLVAKYLMNHKD